MGDASLEMLNPLGCGILSMTLNLFPRDFGVPSASSNLYEPNFTILRSNQVNRPVTLRVVQNFPPMIVEPVASVGF